jgi:hypothetical protein
MSGIRDRGVPTSRKDLQSLVGLIKALGANVLPPVLAVPIVV